MGTEENRQRQRHQRLAELFHRAAALDAAARSRFLRDLRGEDRALRTELEQLLAHDAGGDPDEPPPALAVDPG